MKFIKFFEEFSSKLNKNFWKWFNNSKVVDNDGKPLVVYHGSNNKFENFDINLFNTTESSGDYIGAGFYFSKSKIIATNYGTNIITAYLKITNPLIINDYKSFENYMIKIFGIGKYDIPVYYDLKKDKPKVIMDKMIELGYDGLIDNLYNQYAVFEPNQIKSIDNDGSWDLNDDNIYS